MLLPLLLQTALVLFIAGLVVMPSTLHPIVARFVTVFALAFQAVTTVLPALVLGRRRARALPSASEPAPCPSPTAPAVPHSWAA